MDNPVLAAPVVAVLGLLVPIVVSLLKARSAPTWLGQAVAIVVSIAAGAASVAVTGGFGDASVAEVLGASWAVFAIAQTAYRLWFAATPLNASLEAIVFGSPATGPSLAVVLAGAATVLALGP